MSDPRILIDKDKRLPDSLAGDANKIVAVSADETSYVHSQTVAVTDITGQIILWPLDAPPSGYLICNGAQYNVNDYPALGQLLGGVPGGQFNVPDLTDRFPKGSGGSSTNTTQAQDIQPHTHDSVAAPNHSHSLTINAVSNHRHASAASATPNLSFSCDNYGASPKEPAQEGAWTGYAGSHGHTGSIGVGGSHDHTIKNNAGTRTQPACTLLNFCIKT